jgi:hypothetical protein
MPPELTNQTWFSTGAPLSIGALVFALLLDAVLSCTLAWFYIRFGRSLSNRRVLARTFPFVSLTTVLIISVVKSSLALSLGLVGALSIVRFRTPVKEPEELAYLFMAIALGRGFGANQWKATIVAFVVIMIVLLVWSWSSRRPREHNMYLNVEVPDGENREGAFARLLDLMALDVQVADLRRLDTRDGTLHATFLVHCEGDQSLIAVVDRLKRQLPGAAISFVDQDQLLGA